ncbi:MAG: hypothetical protein Q7N50_05525 [Armatimonadota bacterium]|nr:hypothetical protein [Armatimonadota bacterium]
MAKPSGAQAGNKNAAKGAFVRDALRKVAVQNPEKLRKACEAVLDKAVDGDIGAFSVFRDTLDGKPNQSITVPDGLDIHVIERVIVREKK